MATYLRRLLTELNMKHYETPIPVQVQHQACAMCHGMPWSLSFTPQNGERAWRLGPLGVPIQRCCAQLLTKRDLLASSKTPENDVCTANRQ